MLALAIIFGFIGFALVAQYGMVLNLNHHQWEYHYNWTTGFL